MPQSRARNGLMGCFWSRRTYETQVEPVDAKSDLIGRPLHQVAAVQKQFGYENSSATKWKREKDRDTNWDSRAKNEQMQARFKRSGSANFGPADTPRSSRASSKDITMRHSVANTPLSQAIAAAGGDDLGDLQGGLIGQPIHEEHPSLVRTLPFEATPSGPPGLRRGMSCNLEESGSASKKKRSLKKGI